MKLGTRTKIKLALGFVIVMGILSGVWQLMLLGLLVVGWMAFGRWRAVSPGAQSALNEACAKLGLVALQVLTRAVFLHRTHPEEAAAGWRLGDGLRERTVRTP